jgi:hypothetical protein
MSLDVTSVVEKHHAWLAFCSADREREREGERDGGRENARESGTKHRRSFIIEARVAGAMIVMTNVRILLLTNVGGLGVLHAMSVR